MLLFFSGFVSANTYIADLSFTTPNSVYSTGERVELVGSLSVKNYTSNGTFVGGAAVPLANTLVNISIFNATSNLSTINVTTDSSGVFYSRSDFYTSAPLINAPNSSGDYGIRAIYTDPNGTLWVSNVYIYVLNHTIDQLQVRTDQAAYTPSESITITAAAILNVGDRTVFVNNVSINGTVRNSTSKSILSSFNCTITSTGMCSVVVTAPATYGDYFVELNDFKVFSGFTVIPFAVNAYMKDELGKGFKNTFALGEQASIAVEVVTNSTGENYNFSGYIADSSGNVVKIVNATTLNTNNSYTNTFVFTADTLTFSYGTYYAQLTVTKQGGGTLDVTTSFEVQDWSLAVSRRTQSSGFEYDYSTFVNKTLYFEAYPKHRANGTIIPALNSTAFLINLTDKLNNNLGNANASWNASCGAGGCYEFSLNSPLITGTYYVVTTLSSGGAIQTTRNTLYVVDTVMSAQSTNIDGSTKELFGTNEFIYVSLNSYNLTSASFNLSDAEVFLVTYMNGSEMNYTNVSQFSFVNSTNNASEWAWNASLQRIKIDTPKSGGVYSILIFAQNRTIAATARVVVNPYDICTVAKNTPGTVSTSLGSYYYVWQFKTTDTVYFELKTIQASNPLGKAAASNFSGGNSSSSSYGMGSACSVNTQTQQVVTNATVTVKKAINTQNGVVYALNTSASVCFAIDNQGGYSCTVAPAAKWDGGTYAVEMLVTGTDGSSDIVYGLFEARAFYLYGYSSSWQNGPTSNLSLTMRMYEAGTNWWGNYGSGGLSGTVTVEKIEYLGGEGDWVWPPVDSGYNVSQLNATSISTGTGTVTVPASGTKSGMWGTGQYRIVLKGVDSSGNVDYGYVWFSVKLWDVYGSPIECTQQTGCNYKSYFNSKENITLYIKISNAATWDYNAAGGQPIGGNVTISVKKVQDCRKWPCRELNSTEYTASAINVNESNSWYWGSEAANNTRYIIGINKSAGSTWGTGWYSVVLDVNGTDTGYAWFNTIAFYADARPVANDSTTWKYSIKPQETMYYNMTLTKGYAGSYLVSNISQYLNASIDDVTLRSWDQATYQTKEFNYPEDINVTVIRGATGASNLTIMRNGILNVSYLNGSWPAGYYWGELVMKNEDNETSTAWLWFNVQPFRVELSTPAYEVDGDNCVNGTLNIREPDWTSNAFLDSNYSITHVFENVWGGNSNSLVTYTNYTNTSFANNISNARFCPNSGQWGSGSWGGYHYLNVVVTDNANNNTQTGGLSFRSVPFRTAWSTDGGSNKRSNENINVTVSLTKAIGGGAMSGNLTRLYQWRSDSTTNFASILETYNFTVYANGSSTCSSVSSSNCLVNGSATVVIASPLTGWKVGSNYLYGDWVSNGGGSVQDYNGVYFTGLEAYNGYYDNVDANGYWKNGFSQNENVTLRITVRNSSYTNVAVNISSIQYGLYSNGCYSDWCASFSTATWSFASGGTSSQITNGSAIVRLHMPSGGWSKGTYTLKTAVSGGLGSSIIVGGSFQIKDTTAPNVTLTFPAINQTVSTQNFSFSATTTENAICSISAMDYGSFQNWYCGGWAASNASNASYGVGCNQTRWGLNNATTYQTMYSARDYYSFYNTTYYESYQVTSGGLSTGSTSHTYTFNVSKWKRGQDYGFQVWCHDSDYNSGQNRTVFHLNYTGA